MRWIGSRRIVDEHPEFTPEIDIALREWRGPGFYRSTGERISFEVTRKYGKVSFYALYIDNEKEFNILLR